MIRLRSMNPAALLVLSYCAAILIGACILTLRFSTVSGHLSFLDALFTATSAVCVTGLVVVDTGSCFTLVGQTTILLLIQLGGLGIMTVSVALFASFGKRISLKQRLVIQSTFTHSPSEDIYEILKAIVVFTGIVELIGTALLYGVWAGECTPAQALYRAVFHSVSAFCNAGFSLFRESFMPYRGSTLLNLTVCFLIVAGGIGFPVVYDLYRRATAREGEARKFSVQTKVVLLTTLILIVSGTAAVFSLERSHVLKDLPLGQQVMAALFQSVTARTAGFNTVPIGFLGSATLTFLMFLMFVGASPGSCGGGVKTTTLAVLSAFTWSRLRRRIRVNMFKKTVPRETVNRSVSLFVLAVTTIAVLFFLLLLSEQHGPDAERSGWQFLEYLFEVFSAFGTVGLSMGATAKLNALGKCLIVVAMFIGRVGVLTVSYLIAGEEGRKGFEYAEENLMIG